MTCGLCNATKEKYRLIYEDDVSSCIVGLRPLKEGHILIIPKRHITEYSELNEKESKSMFSLITKMQNILKKMYNQDIIATINRGIHSSEPHIHIHLLPAKGSIRKLVSLYEKIPELKDMNKENMEKIKEKIKQEADKE